MGVAARKKTNRRVVRRGGAHEAALHGAYEPLWQSLRAWLRSLLRSNGHAVVSPADIGATTAARGRAAAAAFTGLSAASVLQLLPKRGRPHLPLRLAAAAPAGSAHFFSHGHAAAALHTTTGTQPAVAARQSRLCTFRSRVRRSARALVGCRPGPLRVAEKWASVGAS